MTDRTIIRTDGEHDLAVAPHEDGVLLSLLPWREAPAHIGAIVQTGPLLAAIDAADPDAMRAYLRETLMHEDRENLRAYLEPEQLDAIPEADSPEDVDERRLCDPLTDEQLAELRASARTLGEAWRTFTGAVREGRFGADR